MPGGCWPACGPTPDASSARRHPSTSPATTGPSWCRGDAGAVLGRCTGDPPEALIVVSTTWAFGYFSLEQRRQFVDLLEQVSQCWPVAWLSAEILGSVEPFMATPRRRPTTTAPPMSWAPWCSTWKTRRPRHAGLRPSSTDGGWTGGPRPPDRPREGTRSGPTRGARQTASTLLPSGSRTKAAEVVGVRRRAKAGAHGGPVPPPTLRRVEEPHAHRPGRRRRRRCGTHRTPGPSNAARSRTRGREAPRTPRPPRSPAPDRTRAGPARRRRRRHWRSTSTHWMERWSNTTPQPVRPGLRDAW